MTDADPIAETLREMYAAATGDDLEALAAIFDQGFYAYDLGKRFDGLALGELIRQAHAAGSQFVWTVQDVDSHVVGDWAWIAYVNRGSVPTERRWPRSPGSNRRSFATTAPAGASGSSTRPVSRPPPSAAQLEDASAARNRAKAWRSPSKTRRTRSSTPASHSRSAG